MNNPLVSIIIPTYNVENYIDECMQSLLMQTYDNIEIIVCDDCSTDDTVIKLEKYSVYPNIKILKNDRNMKQALTRNKCIRESKGEFILLQDADDVSKVDRVEKLLSAFEDNIDFVGSGAYCFNETDGIYEEWYGANMYPQKKDLLIRLPHVHASIMFRRNCLETIDGYRHAKYNERVEDYDMIMRVYAAGFKGKNIDDLLYGYRVDRAAIRRRTFKSRINESIVRFLGFKANKILLPFGWVFIFKPFPAYIVQIIKYRKVK